jgi:hypothetical protein
MEKEILGIKKRNNSRRYFRLELKRNGKRTGSFAVSFLFIPVKRNDFGSLPLHIYIYIIYKRRGSRRRKWETRRPEVQNS